MPVLASARGVVRSSRYTTLSAAKSVLTYVRWYSEFVCVTAARTALRTLNDLHGDALDGSTRIRNSMHDIEQFEATTHAM
jgi:hypothetical protein